MQAIAVEKIAQLSKDVSDSAVIQMDPTDTNTVWYLASYDPPFRITNRHNEVFLPIVDIA